MTSTVSLIHLCTVNSSSGRPPPTGPPPVLRSFPNPGGGAIAEIFQPGLGDLDVFHHGDWRIITWQISLEKILNSFANGLILILWNDLSVPYHYCLCSLMSKILCLHFSPSMDNDHYKNDLWVHRRPSATYETWLKTPDAILQRDAIF